MLKIYCNQQKELKINYGFEDSPFGEMLIMTVDDKICYLGFVNNYSKEEVLNIAKKSFKNLAIDFMSADLKDIGKTIFTNSSKNILLIGTPFQIDVWQALIKIDKGTVLSYEDLAKSVDGIDSNRNYTRATATAIANNKISYLIPCHRVIAKNGSIHNYLWGADLKRKILTYEGVNLK
ncbi:MAG: methylated-DNA--[protein]-cysteine S-methyltransferase [Alphaproteobacteria bacterium]|jgi:AraC family transcriptional regulator of adaptative response/methylated-DNA-[protein]-cysteine methyltransferase|nr:methylated-DNA--[protein]-cysteine S-methyltransferase [Alphaproteobacteria bacterium]